MQISVRSQFGKHVPRILRRQLILQLMQQYLNVDHTEETITTNECKPTIQRFHGALLFVDISGFTALSLQLSPEDLKYHINEYFTKMLDIVDKHGGDVIKFAGDALFIIWETSQILKQMEEEVKSDDEDKTEPVVHDFRSACRRAVTTAVNCGLEINETCSNHRVSLLPRNAMRSGNTTSESSNSHSSASPGSTPTSRSIPSFSFSATDKAFACLNVHSGVTIGLMAGVDIGCNDRWEFFLMGEPLTSVAVAESQASMGEIVVCPEAHALLHPSAKPTFQRAMAKLRICNALTSKHYKRETEGPATTKFQMLAELRRIKNTFNESAVAMPCGCLKGANGYCKVRKTDNSPTNRPRRNKIKSKLEEGVLFDETNNEIESVFVETVGKRMMEITTVDDLHNEFIRHCANAVALNVSHVPHDLASAARAALNVKTLGDRVKVEFMKWAHSCLIDDIARHVHDVVRSDYCFEDTSRIDVCRREIKAQLAALNATDTVMKAKEKFHAAMIKNRQAKTEVKLEKTMGILEGTRLLLKKNLGYGKLFGASNGSSKSERNNVLTQESAGSTGEIRSVTVMFINIDMPHMDLLVEKPVGTSEFGQFGFLSTTVNEGLADILLLHRLQACMEALSDAFIAHGGQMRQFIVDDKGTVCIGTFGLRGAVSNDNAASTLETANMIIHKLQALGLNCSIGVTLGKAFCGLVGSPKRHEYAVMGPSTNLSARLMCKAPPGGIICDLEIRDHDRTHQFVTLADIIAKGYKQPVSIFQPLFKEEEQQGHWTKLKMSREFSHILDFASEDAGDGGSTTESSANGRRQSSLVSPEVTLPIIIQKLIKGPYYGSISNGEEGYKKQELIGRKPEVKNVLKFLFTDVLEVESSSFLTDKPARFVGILGCKGLGKSSLMHAVVHQVSMTLSNKTLKVHVFKTRLSSFQAAVPFNAWKSVIKEMLIRMFNLSALRAAGNAGGARKRSITASMSVDVVSCVSFVMSLISERMRKYEPLLGFLGIIPEQSEELQDLKLSNQDIIMKSMELLFEIIQAFVKSTKQLVFLVIEDLHLFDLASEMLLKQIWNSGTGILVLFSAEHTVHQNPLKPTGTPTATTAVNAEVVAAAAVNHRFTDLVQTDFARTLFNHERFYTFELALFTKAQTFDLIKETVASMGVACVDGNLMEKIFDESGGNPMYASELAKSVAQNHKEQIDPSHVSMKLKNCHRLEEIICHRFDQLSTSAQSLLKIAAAMCCFGSSFTFSMLMYVMEDTNRSNLEMQVVKDLLDIVNSESFLTAKRTSTLDSAKGSKHGGSNRSHHDDDDLHEMGITAEQISSNNFHFEFNIKLEKQTIYELLLGDHKELIHEKIAEYFQDQRHLHPENSCYFHEESLHWQRASNWIHAMACSYYAAKACKNEHQANDHVETAYRMYRAMRNQRNPFESVKLADWSVESMAILFELAETNSDDLFDTQHCPIGIETVSHMFDCDPELLKISLEVEILTSRKRLKTAELLRENQKYIEEGIQILMLTKNSRILNPSRVTQMMRLMKHKTNQAVYEPCERPEEALYFTVGSDYLSLCLKLLDVFVENYLHFTNEHDLNDLFDKVQFAMDEFDALIRDQEEFHQIHCWSLDLKLQCKDGNFKQACTLGQKILDVYSVEKHSSGLISFYGYDSTASSLAMISQYLLLSSEWRIPHRFLLFAQQTLQKLSHVASISAAVHFVANSLVFLKRFDEAVDVFTHYLNCVSRLHEERTMNDGIILEWLHRLVRFEKFIKTGNRELFEQDAAVLDDTILNGGIEHLKESLFDRLSVEGRSIDAVLAEVCALKIIALWNDELPTIISNKLELLRGYCRALSGYVRSTLAQTSGRPHERMFCKTNTVLSVLHLLLNIARDKSPEKQALVVEDLITGVVEFPELQESDLWRELREVVDEELIQRIVGEAHPQFSVFSHLAVNLMRKATASPPLSTRESRCASRLGFSRGSTVGGTVELAVDGFTPFSDPGLGAGAAAVVSGGGVGGGVAEGVTVRRDWDVNREVRGNVHQLMLNGCCTQKMKVLESYKVPGLAATLALT